MEPSWELGEAAVVLKAPVPARWLAAATGAPWRDAEAAAPRRDAEAGLVLYPWDDDGLKLDHIRRRLAARARQAAASLAAWPGPPVPLPLDPLRVGVFPAAILSDAGPSDAGPSDTDPSNTDQAEAELPVVQQGFDLRIRDELATMADLTEAINRFAAGNPWTRTRPPVAAAACEGCPTCCQDPVPVSALDLARLGTAGRTPHMGAGGDLAGCMVTLPDGYCAFLDRGTRRCTVHGDRPWVCRTYFCCPEGPVAEAVREEIVGHILASTLDLGVETPLRHADDYRQVLLIDLISAPVWKAAYDPEGRLPGIP
ncbi:MAG TPA: YkgJ family cysteine cluster protein [Symbiobacteriaceae bacterium]|jgi:hypothetical protein